jgi:hypothetical protein
MSKITRSDVFVRDEKGGAWFEEFLRSLAEEKEGSVQDVIDAIQYKKSETVQGVVEEYRKMVGLDTIEASDEKELVSQAGQRPLSVRHAKMLEGPEEDIIALIEKDPALREDIRSLCEHSGGTKNTLSIINHLREKMGKDLVSYSNSDLIKYIEEAKKKFRGDTEEQSVDAGRVGTDTEDHPEDNAADYITHGKGS